MTDSSDATMDMGSREDRHAWMLRSRGVEDPCLVCHGWGTKIYSSGSTWRGGAGTASCARDVCDSCWGTGDRYRTGVDLRRLRDEDSERIAEAALTAVSDSVGATHGGGHVVELLFELDKIIDRRRQPMSVFGLSSLLALRNLIARALGNKERRL